MGLFSSSYKYYAYAGSSSLFEEDRPNTILQMILNGIIDGSADIPESTLIGFNTNLYARAKSMVKYAEKTPGGYKFGFPETNQNIYNITTDMLRPYIEAAAGGAIDFRTLYWGGFDDPGRQAFFIEKEINEKYTNNAYFPWDGTIGLPADTNWSPVDDEIDVPVEDTSNPGTYLTSNNQYDVNISGNDFQVSFPIYNGVWDVAQPFDMSSYNVPGTWIQVRYRMAGGGDQYLYWAYLIGSNAIPALDAQISSSTLQTRYYPMAILMHDTKWFDEVGDLEWEETLDRLLKDLASDPYDIKEDYLTQLEEDRESGENDRGGADDWDFFIHFAVPLKTRDRGGREYLFHFYDWLRQNATWTTFAEYQDFLSAKAGGLFSGLLNKQPFSELIVEEGVQYTGYIARYAWSYIETLTVPGPFTPPNWVEPLKPRRCWSDTLKRTDPDYATWLELVHQDTFSQPGGGGTYLLGPGGDYDGEEHTYTIVTRMNEDNTHTHILMMGPGMEYQINTSITPVGVGANGYVDYRYRFVDVELWPEDPEEDSEFRWPMQLGATKKVSAIRREAALQDGLCATVFLVKKQKVKWYQKGFFKWLIIIIVVIIVVILWQYEVLPSLAAAAGAATGATAIGLWAVYVVLTFAVGFLVSFAGNLIGGPLGQLFVIVAMFMAAGGNFSDLNIFGNIRNAWGNLTFSPGFGSAINFINAVSMPVQVVQQVYIKYELNKLEAEMEDFIKTNRERYEQLQDAWDSLDEGPEWLDPLDLAQTFTNRDLWEQPEQFYYRTLNANPGILGYDLIQNFTDMALMLPQQTMGPGIVDVMINQFAEQRGQA